MTTAFDRTTAVHPVHRTEDSATFAAELDDSWSSLHGVHGGYLTALSVSAAQAFLPARAVRTVTTSFLRPSAVGPAEITLEVVRSGRSLTTLAAMVRQAGRNVAATRVTMLAPVTGASWSAPVGDGPAALADCVDFTPPPIIKHFTQARLRIDPATVPMADGGPARIAGHVRPLEPRPFDAPWLVMAGDWFPPSPFRRVAPPVGGVSLDYTVHLHRTLPDDAEVWLEGVFETPDSIDGIALEHGTLATPDRVVVAETFHTRWTGT